MYGNGQTANLRLSCRISRIIVSVSASQTKRCSAICKYLYGKTQPPAAGTETALRIYTRASPGYHPITQAAVDKILDWRK